MPPKIKVHREDILSAGVEIVRQEGVQALNARRLASRLGCSTQPIFSNFATMEELRQGVITQAHDLYLTYLSQAGQASAYPPYKASGMAYIRFAQEEKNLFHLLFMRDRSQESLAQGEEDLLCQVKRVQQATGLSAQAAYRFHLEMWIFVHGIATMLATGYLPWDWQNIDQMLTDVFQGLKQRNWEDSP